MKYLLVSLFVLTTLGSAAAQSGEFIGGSFKVELGPAADFFDNGDDVSVIVPDSLALELQAGDYNLFGPFGFREVIGTNFTDFLEFGTDVLLPLTSRPIIYLGAGVGLTASDSIIFNARGVVGLELGLTSHLGLFGELNPGYYVAWDRNGGAVASEDFGAKVRFGFNYHP